MTIVSAVACKPPFNTWKQHLQAISLVMPPPRLHGWNAEKATVTGLEAPEALVHSALLSCTANG